MTGREPSRRTRSAPAGLNSADAFLEDQAGTLWLGTAGAGLLRHDRDRRVVTQYVKDPVDPNSLRNNVVSSLHQDPSGTIWMGTLGGGANNSNLSIFEATPAWCGSVPTDH